MRGGCLGAIALLVILVLLTPSSCRPGGHETPYPNDEKRILDSLTKSGLTAVTVSAREHWLLSEGGSYTTLVINYTTSSQPAEVEKELTLIQRTAWDLYPHNLSHLDVRVIIGQNRHKDMFAYGDEELTSAFGPQDHREGDSPSDDEGAPARNLGAIILVIFCLLFVFFMRRVKVRRHPQRRGRAPRTRRPRYTRQVEALHSSPPSSSDSGEKSIPPLPISNLHKSKNAESKTHPVDSDKKDTCPPATPAATNSQSHDQATSRKSDQEPTKRKRRRTRKPSRQDHDVKVRKIHSQAPAQRSDLARSDNENSKTKRPHHISKFVSANPPLNRADAQDAWERLRSLAPDPSRPVSYLSKKTGVPFRRVMHLKEVRDCTSHSDRFGWPSQEDVDRALRTGLELKRKLGIDD